MATALGCEHCEFGWRRIAPGAVDATLFEPLDLDGLDVADRARLEMVRRCEIAAARNTWYPCKHCNADRFFRWVGGHYGSDHDRGSCEDCVEAGLAGRRRGGATIRRGTAEGDAAMAGERF